MEKRESHNLFRGSRQDQNPPPSCAQTHTSSHERCHAHDDGSCALLRSGGKPETRPPPPPQCPPNHVAVDTLPLPISLAFRLIRAACQNHAKSFREHWPLQLPQTHTESLFGCLMMSVVIGSILYMQSSRVRSRQSTWTYPDLAIIRIVSPYCRK